MKIRAQFIWIFLPVLPLLLGFGVLHILNDGTITLLSDAVTAVGYFSDDVGLRFFNALVIYAAVALFQVVGCFAVALYMGSRLWVMPPDLQRSSLVTFAFSVLILIGINILARQDGFSGALNIGYRSTCDVLVASGGAPHILPQGCTDPGLSHLAWMGLLPYIAGVFAAASASALVSTAYQQKNLAIWADIVEQAFRATAFVLVASTVAMMLFYNLPLAVVEEQRARDLISGFAQGMTMFWGMTFTLTLLAVFGPAHLLISRAMARQEAADTALQDRVAAWSMSKQTTRILTTLAPLLVGSSATVIELLSGAITG